jgi:hypothetical protein
MNFNAPDNFVETEPPKRIPPAKVNGLIDAAGKGREQMKRYAKKNGINPADLSPEDAARLREVTGD